MLTVRENHYEPGLFQPRHAHAETSVTIVLAGRLRERVGRIEEIARSLSFVVKPGDTEHETEFECDVHTLQILIPADSAIDLEASSSSGWRWRWQHGGPAVPRFMDLLRMLRAAAGRPMGHEHVARAACDALAAAQPPSDSSHKGEPPRWLALARQALDDAQHSIRVRALATSADVHPVYLARQFRHWYGCSITEHVQRRRVQEAASAMTSSTTSLSVISHEVGFCDHPHMCRVFVRETGVSPSAFRGLAATQVPSVQDASVTI